MECNNRKPIPMGTNIYSIGLNNHWKLNETTIQIYTSCGKQIAQKLLRISLRLTNQKTAKAKNLALLINQQNFFRVSTWTTSYNSRRDFYWRQSLVTPESLLVFQDNTKNRIVYILDSTSSKHNNVNVEFGNSNLKQRLN